MSFAMQCLTRDWITDRTAMRRGSWSHASKYSIGPRAREAESPIEIEKKRFRYQPHFCKPSHFSEPLLSTGDFWSVNCESTAASISFTSPSVR